MAKEDNKKPARRIRKPETVRDRTTQAAKSDAKPKHLRKVSRTAIKPFQRAKELGAIEMQLPLTHKIPNNRVGKIITKRRSAVPSYFINAFKELRLVKWPTNRETVKLTSAVFVFAIFFGLIVAVVDYVLDKIFKELIL